MSIKQYCILPFAEMGREIQLGSLKLQTSEICAASSSLPPKTKA